MDTTHTAPTAAAPHRPKYYKARRDTRWDVYPQQEPVEVVALDYQGFWAKTVRGEWFKSPASYLCGEQITEAEAAAIQGTH